MSSFPLISHRLFVAAINEENGTRSKRNPSKAVIDVQAAADPATRARTNGAESAQSAMARMLRTGAGAAGF